MVARLALVTLLLSGCRQQPAQAKPPAQESTPAVQTPTAPPHPFAPASVEVIAKAPLFALPPSPELSPAGESLVLNQETGGQRVYNRSPYPEWPEGQSGITVGIGYDCSTNSAAVIRGDWSMLGAANASRLAATHPYAGQRAEAHLRDVRDILVSWSNATQVFDTVDVARTFRQCQHAFAGFDDLRPNCQAALVSLVFNRGASMIGDGRREMRAIRDNGVPSRDYGYIAAEFRAMIRIWVGTSIYDDMRDRRRAEAALVLTP
jgi:hypothetical protein